MHRAQTVWAHPSSEIIRAGLKQVIYGRFNFHQKKNGPGGNFHGALVMDSRWCGRFTVTHWTVLEQGGPRLGWSLLLLCGP